MSCRSSAGARVEVRAGELGADDGRVVGQDQGAAFELDRVRAPLDPALVPPVRHPPPSCRRRAGRRGDPGHVRSPRADGDFDYDLPAGLIAQQARPRGTSRLLVLDRASGGTSVHRFSALPTFLRPGDLLVLNEVRVIPARLRGTTPGGRVEMLLVRAGGGGAWEAMVGRPNGSGPAAPPPSTTGRAPNYRRTGTRPRRIGSRFDPPLERQVPRRSARCRCRPTSSDGGPAMADRERYQTVYARHPGGPSPRRLPGISRRSCSPTLDRTAACGSREVTLARRHRGPSGRWRPTAIPAITGMEP